MASIVTTKGQVTIPKHVREALGIRQGDRVAFELDGTGGARLRKAPDLTLEEALTYFHLPYVSDEDIERAAEEGWISDYR